MKKEKVKEYIENIEQLGADARYYFDLENIEKLKVQLESILYWSKKAIKEIEKENKEK